MTDATGMHWTDPTHSDKHYWHRYSRFYERHLRGIGPVRSILEYGVFKGDSIRWLLRTFPEARIIGADILPIQPSWPVDPRVEYLTIDQDDRAGVAALLAGLGRRFDLVIEDGSHLPPHQANCLVETLPYVRPGGTFILEDIQTSHPRHPYFAETCAPGTATSLSLLLAAERALATGAGTAGLDYGALSAGGLFTPEEARAAVGALDLVEIYHRATLPLRCYACGGEDFDVPALRCACGVDLDMLTPDSMTAVLRKR